MTLTRIAAAVTALAITLTGTAHAQQQAAPATPGLSLELNALSDQNGACRITFLARNSGAADVEQAVFETVILTADGAVARLTLFDFQSLPAGRPRVRQFDLAGLACRDLGTLLVNGTTTCIVGGAASDACARPGLSSRTDVEIAG